MEFKERYNNIFQSNIDHIRENNIAIDPLPVEGEDRWGISAVIRPKLPLEVWKDLNELKPLLGLEHAYYSPKNVHITLRSIEAYRSNVTESDELVKIYAEAVKKIFESIGNPTVSFTGIIGARSGLILCGIPNFDLMQARIDLFNHLKMQKLSHSGPERNLNSLRNTFHASLAVFGKELEQPNESADKLISLHAKAYSEIDISNVDIVSYKRTFNNIEVQTLASIDISG